MQAICQGHNDIKNEWMNVMIQKTCKYPAVFALSVICNNACFYLFLCITIYLFLELVCWFLFKGSNRLGNAKNQIITQILLSLSTNVPIFKVASFCVYIYFFGIIKTEC